MTILSSSQDIHFSCTQCGKCCNKSPKVNYFDMLELSDEFIFQTSHNAVISFKNKIIEKEDIEHYQKLGHTILLPELESSLFYWIDFISLNNPSYTSCSKLKDNKCTIHSKKPQSCQLAPFGLNFSEKNQWKSLNYYKDNVEKNNWGCDFSKNSSLVFSNNSLYQNHTSSVFYNNLNFIKDFTDKYIEFLSFYGEERKNKHFKALFVSYKDGSLMLTDLIQSLLVLKSYNIVGKELIVKTIENQIRLLETEIKKSTIFKVKKDLQYTRSFKKIKEDYIKCLNNKIFDYNENENFNLVS